MELVAEGLDDLLIDLYQRILREGDANKGSRGDTVEILAVSLHVEKPRARISRSENRGKPFSALGELLWYLSGSDQLSFIEPYVSRYKDEAVDGAIHGAYGPRLLRMREGIDQLSNVARLLRERPGSRRAVVQLFNAEDLTSNFKEIPCTTTIQFLLRNNRLDMSVTMRSNDAYWGLPHDFFCFSMLQEMMAIRIGANLGQYHQYVGSMHIYDQYIEGAKAYISEGHQKSVEMPNMPPLNPFSLVPALLTAEYEMRSRNPIDANAFGLDEYWTDIIRLLEIFWSRSPDRIEEIGKEMHHDMYRPYVAGRRDLRARAIKRRLEK